MDFLRFFTDSSAAEYQVYYASLIKPSFAPPDWLFGVAWGIIYPLIAVALCIALYRYFKKTLPGLFIVVFVINLIANLLFTPIQLGFKNNLLASIDILVVLTSLIYLETMAYTRARVIFILLLPYLLWGGFATVLLLSITVLNW